MRPRARRKAFLICLDNRGYRVSLIPHKLYEQIPDPVALKRGLVRVVDESGEDYLFPARPFAGIDIPGDLQRRLAS